MSHAASRYNADNPDISAVREAGGRMIVRHGWADATVTPYKTVGWHEQASVASAADVRAWSVVLFMVPGLDHCGIVPGPDGINPAALDPMTPLEAWLADGTPPRTILAA